MTIEFDFSNYPVLRDGLNKYSLYYTEGFANAFENTKTVDFVNGKTLEEIKGFRAKFICCLILRLDKKIITPLSGITVSNDS